MFAVIRTGGKQYKVTPGALLEIEKLDGEVDSEISLADVLLYADGEDIRIGKPVLSDVSVTATIVGQKKGVKTYAFKKIRRHGKQCKKGHRQQLTVVKVKEISFN